MNAKVENNPDLVTINVDGLDVQVPKGSMIIEATDSIDVDVPRFCYHKKLSVAANCRMCLVEIEQGGRPVPKPMPACATPVADGMKVMTQSPRALAAQRGVMEFLLINHPLDCPVCDQGGECELQDLSMGYGRGVSRFTERKRIVADENLGPLVATEMTRCIHCTRCVRFLKEIAGQKELGGMGRGEYTKISTYVEEGVTSELSGNIIDLCPVGALTNKPYRFQARPWELLSHASIAPHDSVGSNIYLHHRRGQVMRVVPRENEALNETWLADRDRFSYKAIYSEARLEQPLIKRDGQWQEVDWETALAFAVDGLKRVAARGADALGTLVSPTATLEEMHLVAKLSRGLGSENIDHRLRRADFRDADAGAPLLGRSVESLERADAALVVAGNPRSELPLINLRLRKATLRGGKIAFLNPRHFDVNYEAEQLVAAPQHLVRELALLVQALGGQGIEGYTGGAQPGEQHQALAKTLKDAGDAAVLVGALAEAHPDGSILRALAAQVAELSGATYGQLPEAANSVGGFVAGTTPRGGRNAREMLEQPRTGYLLFNVEPEFDCWNGAQALAAVEQAEFVAVLSPFVTERAKAYANVILPIGTFSETSGTFVNLEGRRQSFAGVAAPVGDARPAWRVLRVLGNLLDLAGFEYEASGEVLAELGQAEQGAKPTAATEQRLSADAKLVRMGGVSMFAGDTLQRHSQPLQDTVHAGPAKLFVSSAQAAALGLDEGGQARVRQDGAEVLLPVVIDESIPMGSVWVPAALEGSYALGAMVGEVTVARA